ncbi:MAG: hypothetical protein QOE54_7338 [Streptosporangiaceae bacterium]|nr:hypothetical protein [Streptosporangiaceae bacterium]MDX6434972.1 hypothetical protein [Streptosporangiaceae bacterium]
MTEIAEATPDRASAPGTAGHRSVHGLTVIIGLFIIIVMGFVIAKPFTGRAYTATEAIILGASALRGLTPAMAWAALVPALNGLSTFRQLF